MSGRIVQIIGAVIDVEFPRDAVPKVYDALNVADSETVLKSSSSWATAWSVLSQWVRPKASSAVSQLRAPVLRSPCRSARRRWVAS